MTTLTKEQLISHARESVSYLEDLKGRVSKEGADCKVVHEMVERDLKLARIALTSLETKPIGAFHIAEQQVDGTSDYIKDGEWPIDNGTIEVYAAPPVPVVPEEKPMPNPLSMYAVDAVAAIAEVRGWNACRAAMLHGAEPASNHEELPLDYLQGQKDGLEWAAQLAEANHPQTGDWLYDDPLELAKAIRKGPDMPEFDGPTPVTLDGWISCSERMPENIPGSCKEYLVFDGLNNKVHHDYWVVPDGDSAPVASFWNHYGAHVTHWMPLPEPPQESKSE